MYCKTKLGYSCSMESVSQIERHKFRNKLSLNPIAIRILEVLKTRSRTSKPTFKTLTCVKCLLMVWCPSSSDVSRRIIVVIFKKIRKGFC